MGNTSNQVAVPCPDLCFQCFFSLSSIDQFGLLNVVPISNLVGIKSFVPSISISFKCECFIVMQIQHTKQLKAACKYIGFVHCTSSRHVELNKLRAFEHPVERC